MRSKGKERRFEEDGTTSGHNQSTIEFTHPARLGDAQEEVEEEEEEDHYDDEEENTKEVKVGEWNAPSRIRLRSLYLLLRMHRCRRRSENQGERRRDAPWSFTCPRSATVDFSLFVSLFPGRVLGAQQTDAAS